MAGNVSAEDRFSLRRPAQACRKRFRGRGKRRVGRRRLFRGVGMKVRCAGQSGQQVEEKKKGRKRKRKTTQQTAASRFWMYFVSCSISFFGTLLHRPSLWSASQTHATIELGRSHASTYVRLFLSPQSLPPRIRKGPPRCGADYDKRSLEKIASLHPKAEDRETSKPIASGPFINKKQRR